MDKKVIDKANHIIVLIEKNKKAIDELSKYAESGKVLYTETSRYTCSFNMFPQPIDFEDWEIRLMIHQKKQRIAALEIQLEQL